MTLILCPISSPDKFTERLHNGYLHSNLVSTVPPLHTGTRFSSSCFFVISEPTVFENYVQDIRIGDQVVELSLWDTAGASFTSLRLRPVYSLRARRSGHRSRGFCATTVTQLLGNTCRDDLLLCRQSYQFRQYRIQGPFAFWASFSLPFLG